MKIYPLILALFITALPLSAQVDRHDVRAGNRKFKKQNLKEAGIDYRKAVVKDSLSIAGEYNLASTLYLQQDFENAGKALETVKDVAASYSVAGGSRTISPAAKGENSIASDYHYNVGDVALQKKDYAAAVEAFKQSLLLNPNDLDAKENYIYAKLMLQNQQNGGGGQNDQNQDNQDQNNDQNQDNQDQNQDQNNDQNQDNQNQNDQNQDQQQQQPQEGAISRQQAQQMLKAIQAREKETQDKVNKEKAALLQSRQKEKNW